MAIISGAITISDVSDGLTGASIVFSNETHTFIASPEGMIDATELNTFGAFLQVYVGTQEYSFTTSNTPGVNEYSIVQSNISSAPSAADLNLAYSRVQVAAGGSTTLGSGSDTYTYTNPSTTAANAFISVADTAGTDGFIDANSGYDTISISVPIIVRISSSDVTYNRIISLTKAKGGNARVVRLGVNQQIVEYPREPNAVPKYASTFGISDGSVQSAREVDLDFSLTSFNFASGDGAATWSYQENGAGSFSNANTNIVSSTTAPEWSSSATYDAADLVTYTLNNNTAVFESVAGSNTNQQPVYSSGAINPAWTRRTNILGISSTDSDGNHLLKVGPLMFNDILGSNQRLVIRGTRTVNNSDYADQISIVKVMDALGAYSVRITSDKPTVLKNNTGNVTLTAALYLGELAIPSSEINSYAWMKDNVPLTSTTNTAWDANTAYVTGSTVSYVNSNGNTNDDITFNYTALQASTGQTPPTETTGGVPTNNAYWEVTSVVLKSTQPDANHGINSASLYITADDIVADNTDLFTCEIDFVER